MRFGSIGPAGLIAVTIAAVAARAEPPELPAAREAEVERPERTAEAVALGQRWRNGARHLGRDAAYLVSFPKRTNRRGAVAASAVGAGILTLFLLDDEIRAEVQEQRSPALDRWESRIEPLGAARNTALAALATYGLGRALHHERTAETGRALLEAQLFTEAFGMTAKGLFGRERPGRDSRAGDFFKGSSFFPSGHTWRAFAVATVLAERHGRVAAWIGYPLATAVGLSRIERDVHWASDVLAGAALGHLVARSVVRRREGRAPPAPTLRVGPVELDGHAAIGATVRIPLR